MRILSAAASRYLTFAALLTASTLPQNVITTFAGGDWVFPKGSISALNAPFGSLTSLAFAPNGDLLIADADNAIVVRVSPAGMSSIVAGNGISGYSGDGGPATAASLSRPSGVTADASGNIYIADRVNSQFGVVRKVQPQGTITTFSPWTKAASGGAAGPMAVDGAGNVYIADSKRVWRFAPDGSAVLLAGIAQGCGLTPPTCPSPPNNAQATAVTFNFVSGIALDPAGNLLISDQMSRNLYRVTSGLISTVATNIAAYQMACDRAGNLYVPDSVGSYSIKKIAPSGAITTIAGNGTRTYSGDGGPAAAAGFAFASAVTIDASGAIYVADNVRVRTFVVGGNIRVFAGNGGFRFSGDGGATRSATFLSPEALATDIAGNIYVSESTGRIRRVGSNGIVSTVAGNGSLGSSGNGGPAISATVADPMAMAAAADGTLFFTEWDLSSNAVRIRKIAPNGIVSSLNAPAMIGPPAGLTLDRSGNLYVSDTSSSKVYRITPQA